MKLLKLFLCVFISTSGGCQKKAGTESTFAEIVSNDDQPASGSKPLLIYWYTDGCQDPIRDWYSLALNKRTIMKVKSWIKDPNKMGENLANFFVETLKIDFHPGIHNEVASFMFTEVVELDVTRSELTKLGYQEGALPEQEFSENYKRLKSIPHRLIFEIGEESWQTFRPTGHKKCD